jgi:MFS family permease
MAGFSVVWLGQVVSVLGTGMTQFGLTIWAWQVTGQATALALVGFCGFFPLVVMTPLAGALVDRWNPKLVMILSDLAAGLATIGIFVLLKTGHLEIWHLYAAAAFSGIFGAFQFPAYSASITLWLPKGQYTRANAMLGLVQSIAGVFVPIAAGTLLVFIGIGGILTIDIATFVFAITALLSSRSRNRRPARSTRPRRRACGPTVCLAFATSSPVRACQGFSSSSSWST